MSFATKFFVICEYQPLKEVYIFHALPAMSCDSMYIRKWVEFFKHLNEYHSTRQTWDKAQQSPNKQKTELLKWFNAILTEDQKQMEMAEEKLVQSVWYAMSGYVADILDLDSLYLLELQSISIVWHGVDGFSNEVSHENSNYLSSLHNELLKFVTSDFPTIMNRFWPIIVNRSAFSYNTPIPTNDEFILMLHSPHGWGCVLPVWIQSLHGRTLYVPWERLKGISKALQAELKNHHHDANVWYEGEVSTSTSTFLFNQVSNYSKSFLHFLYHVHTIPFIAAKMCFLEKPCSRDQVVAQWDKCLKLLCPPKPKKASYSLETFPSFSVFINNHS